jgi:cytochrome c oxidase assembly factor CtaG/putative copper export protein
MIIFAAGISTGEPLVTTLATLGKFLSITSSFLTVGVLLAMAFFLFDVDGKLSKPALDLRRIAVISSLFWVLSQGLNIVATLANILGSSLGDALDTVSLRSFLTQIVLGQYMFFQFCVALVIALVVGSVRKVASTTGLLLLSLLALVAPLFQSHSAASSSHALAIGSIVIHVVALAFWVGGIFAILLLDPENRAIALPRFSSMALWSVVAVVLSGVANAWARLNFVDAWDSGYARVVIIKVVLTLVLIYLGYINRKSVAHLSEITLAKISKVLFIETIIMISTLALGAWLSSNQAPVRPGLDNSDPAVAIAGMQTPPAPTLWNIFSQYDPDALFIGVLVLAVALYILGVVKLTRQGDRWPVGRTVAFALGISAIDFATSGGLGVYARFSFEYHMIAHMVLGMIAPIGIVLGAPITLALRTLPQARRVGERGIRGSLIALLHSKPTSVITNPVVVLAIFDGSLFALYFTSLFGGMMQSHVGHLAMNVHFILAGILFFHVIIGIDPNPRKVPHIVRIVILFAAMSIHAFFSIALLSTSTLLDQGYFGALQTPWLGDLLTDQHAAGSIGWAMGEIPILLALVATFIQWMRDDKRETRRIDRNEARLAALGEPDDLAQYNNYLSALQQRDKEQGQS